MMQATKQSDKMRVGSRGTDRIQLGSDARCALGTGNQCQRLGPW